MAQTVVRHYQWRTISFDRTWRIRCRVRTISPRPLPHQFHGLGGRTVGGVGAELRIVEMTGDAMASVRRQHLRHDVIARLEPVWTPGVEPAPLWRVDRTRNVTLQHDPAATFRRVDDR